MKGKLNSIPEETFAAQLSQDGFLYEREYRFAPPRRWRFDFAFVDKQLAVEIEGGVWSRGRHVRGTGYAKDCEKYSEAAILGWRIMRFVPEMVMSGYALEATKRALIGEQKNHQDDRSV